VLTNIPPVLVAPNNTLSPVLSNPTFKVSLGFGDYTEFESLVIHRDCVELEDPIRLLVNIFETSDED